MSRQRDAGPNMRKARKRMKGRPCSYPGCTTPSDTVDHIVPQAVDPSRWDDPSNMRPMCRYHNSKLGGELGTARKRAARIAQMKRINRRRKVARVTRNPRW